MENYIQAKAKGRVTNRRRKSTIVTVPSSWRWRPPVDLDSSPRWRRQRAAGRWRAGRRRDRVPAGASETWGPRQCSRLRSSRSPWCWRENHPGDEQPRPSSLLRHDIVTLIHFLVRCLMSSVSASVFIEYLDFYFSLFLFLSVYSHKCFIAFACSRQYGSLLFARL